MLDQKKKTLGAIIFCITAGNLPSLALAETIKIRPHLVIKETYTDNVNLDSIASEGDFVTQISPGFSLTADGARLQASINYDLNFFFYAQSENKKTDLRHNLSAQISSELVEDLLFIDGVASIKQQYLERREAIAFNSASQTENRRTIHSYQLSPYMVNSFGNKATLVTRYSLNYNHYTLPATSSDSDPISRNITAHNFSSILSSGRSFQRLNWSISASHSISDIESIGSDASGTKYKNTLGRLEGGYRFNRFFTLLGSAGYQKRNARVDFVDFAGFVWDAGFRIVPGPRTSFSMRYGNQNGGATYSGQFHYQATKNAVITASYNDNITTYQFLNFSNAIDTVQDQSLSLNSYIDEGFTRRKQFQIGLNGKRGRTDFSVSAYYSKYDSENPISNENRYGGNLNLTRHLNSHLRISVKGGVTRSYFITRDEVDLYWYSSIGTSYDLSKSLSLTAEYAYSNRETPRVGFVTGSTNYFSVLLRANF